MYPISMESLLDAIFSLLRMTDQTKESQNRASVTQAETRESKA